MPVMTTVSVTVNGQARCGCHRCAQRTAPRLLFPQVPGHPFRDSELVSYKFSTSCSRRTCGPAAHSSHPRALQRNSEAAWDVMRLEYGRKMTAMPGCPSAAHFAWDCPTPGLKPKSHEKAMCEAAKSRGRTRMREALRSFLGPVKQSRCDHQCDVDCREPELAGGDRTGEQRRSEISSGSLIIQSTLTPP